MSSIAFDIPTWFVAAMMAIWAGLVIWQFAGRELLASSKDQRRLDQVTTRGQEVDLHETEKGLEHEIKQAGLDFTAQTFNLLRIAGGILVVVIGPVLGLPPLAGIILGVGVWFGARWWLQNRIEGRSREIDNELPAALSRMAALLPMVTSLPRLLMLVGDSLRTINPASPLAAELQATAIEVRDKGQVGLENLEKRAASPALKTLAFNLRIYMSSGGEQSDIMANAARRLQRLIDGRNKARAKASGALLFAKVMPGLLVIVTIFTFQDPMIQAFYRSAVGQIMVVGIVATMAIGYQVMNNMVDNVA